MQKLPFFAGIGTAGRGWALGAGMFGRSAGYVDFNHCHYESLNHTGIARFHNSHIVGETYIAGTVTGSDSRFGGKSTFLGLVDLEGCVFDSILNIVSTTVTLRECSTQDIIINRRGGFWLGKDLYLYDGTTINGDVVFEGGDGRIHLYGGSQIIGNVIGAEVFDHTNGFHNR